ncbi:MAG: DUF3872 domain-containing protein [Tannerellaceae bacterium]|nr:DUF3872 domain-containing protein [Tannerellaceae bacterium]
MKKYIIYMCCAVLIAGVMSACDDSFEVQQAYSFELSTMPVPKKIAEGETVEIRCTLLREGEYQQTEYYIRMFQTDGVGELRMDDGTIFLPNDLYPLNKMVFRLYYTSRCTDQQVIDVYIEDSFGQVVQKTFSWQADSGNYEIGVD